MNRVHTTNRNKIDLNRKYSQRNTFKPVGLWYGIDNEWKDWCEGNDFGGIGKYFYEVEIDFKNILVLTTEKEVLKFHNDFSYSLDGSRYLLFIDWIKVTDVYSGIEIRNYYKIKRSLGFFNISWFYGWDVSSGCIWNLDCITKIKSVK